MRANQSSIYLKIAVLQAKMARQVVSEIERLLPNQYQDVTPDADDYEQAALILDQAALILRGAAELTQKWEQVPADEQAEVAQ